MIVVKFIGRILLAIFCLFHVQTFAQSGLEQTLSNLRKQVAAAPVEKAYLQLDKSYYGAGDTIWFKGYVVTDSKHELSAIGNVLNVELVNDRDSVKQLIKLAMVNGLCHGGLPLSDSTREGNYRVRAYTSWMRNAGEEYFFDKNIHIINAVTNNVVAIAKYSYTNQNDFQQATAVVSYADIDSKPLVNTNVNYTIQQGTKITGKGKDITDGQGNLTINFSKTDTAITGSIISNIKLSDKIVSTNVVPIKSPVSKTTVQFFPEGGSLVSGIDCKIAFKATTSNGLGIAVKGAITDDQGNQVADFNSNKLGMGIFYLNAETGKSYKAKITDANGNESVVQLPKLANHGYVLSVTQAGSENIRVAAEGVSTKDAAPQTDGMTLIAKVGGEIYYQGKSKAGSNSFIAIIPKSKFPTGVVQFTLYSSSGEPLNERLMFIQNDDQLQLDVATEKKTYAPGQKVKLNLTAKTNDGQPVQGSFSVSVTDESKVPVNDNNENNILSNLLLTSDLKRYIEKPGYYFASADQKMAEDMDALMLTQGYRKFTWQEGAKYPADTGLTISGYLITRGNKPAPKATITMYTMDGGFFAWDTVTNNAGRFAFKHLAFANSMKFIVQSAEKQRFQYKIGVDMDNTVAAPNKNAPELSITNDIDLLPFIRINKQLYSAELKYDYNGKAKLLREVLIKAKPQENLASPNSALKGAHADYVVTAKQLTALKIGNTSDALIGLIPGLEFNGRHQLKMGAGSKTGPLFIIVDGFVVPDLDAVRPRNIESIELVLKAQSGLLYVTTKRVTDDDDVTYGDDYTGYKKFSPRGFYKVREFYSPQYDDPKTNKEIADLRTTIYWNPMLQTDKDGNASFEYFNAGSKGNYKVVVEGIDNDGNIGRYVYRYKVE